VVPRILTAVLVILVGMPVAADIHQWTDAQGNTHFSDEPPEDSRHESKKVNPETNAVDTDSAAVKQRRAEQQKYLDERRKQRRKEAENRARREAREERQRQRCKQMKARIKHMESVSRFYEINEDGSRDYLSEAEAQKVRRQRRRRYQQECQ